MAMVLRQGADRKQGADAAPRPATFTFSEMGAQGDAYVGEVRRQAEAIVAAARQQADQIKAEAAAAGKAEARAEIQQMVESQVATELKTLRPALDQAVASIQTARGEWMNHWRTASVKLAVAIAERIVRREIENRPNISEAWLAEALELAAGASEITIRLAPDDLQHLRSHAEKLAKRVAGIGEARFVADDQVSPGGCIVQTQHGVIDQRLETQLDRLVEELE